MGASATNVGLRNKSEQEQVQERRRTRTRATKDNNKSKQEQEQEPKRTRANKNKGKEEREQEQARTRTWTRAWRVNDVRGTHSVHLLLSLPQSILFQWFLFRLFIRCLWLISPHTVSIRPFTRKYTNGLTHMTDALVPIEMDWYKLCNWNETEVATTYAGDIFSL